MTEHCPEDGAFMGDAGCTHPNHQHSKLVQGIIADGKAKKLHTVSEADCDAALTEGFYVDGPNGKRIGFGKSLLRHLDESHSQKDATGRKKRLLYAVNAVMFPTRSEDSHRSIEGANGVFQGVRRIRDTGNHGEGKQHHRIRLHLHTEAKQEGRREMKRLAAWPATAPCLGVLTLRPATLWPTSRLSPWCAVEGDSRVRAAPPYRFAAWNDTTSAPNAQGGF